MKKNTKHKDSENDRDTENKPDSLNNEFKKLSVDSVEVSKNLSNQEADSQNIDKKPRYELYNIDDFKNQKKSFNNDDQNSNSYKDSGYKGNYNSNYNKFNKYDSGGYRDNNYNNEGSKPYYKDKVSFKPNYNNSNYRNNDYSQRQNYNRRDNDDVFWQQKFNEADDFFENEYKDKPYNPIKRGNNYDPNPNSFVNKFDSGKLEGGQDFNEYGQDSTYNHKNINHGYTDRNQYQKYQKPYNYNNYKD